MPDQAIPRVRVFSLCGGEEKSLTTEEGFRLADVVGDWMSTTIEDQIDLVRAPDLRVQDGHRCVFHPAGPEPRKRSCTVRIGKHLKTYTSQFCLVS
jgi:hypothetical protein